MGSSILNRQPVKYLFSSFTLITLPLRLMFIFLYYIPKPLRQHKEWTWRKAVGNAVFAVWWKYASTVHFRTAKSLDPGSLKERFIVIPPSANPSIYSGVVDSPIRPATIGACWYPTPYAKSGSPQIVSIHFHGGAYVLGGCRPLESGWGPMILSKYTKGPVLQPQYRLAVEEASCFPAALQDAITTYSYVLNELGVDPNNVVLSGESAGGHLAISVLRYLLEEKTLPLPRAVLLWSPWVDLGAGSDAKTVDANPNAKSDWIMGSLAEWGAERYTPEGWDRSHPYISPLGNEFASVVPVFVQAGTAEILYKGVAEFAEAMRTKGTEVEFLAIENAPHDTFGGGQIVGWSKEAEKAAEKAAKFIEKAGVATT